MQRRETALERWQRVINYNLGLVSDIVPIDELRNEALLMLDKYSQLKADLSGRTKWVGGTKSTELNPAANFNCSFLAVNRLESFADAFHLLMLGVGVGFRVFGKDIKQLPALQYPSITVEFEDYNPVDKSKRNEHTSIHAAKQLTIKVGDSRKGWVDATMAFINYVTRTGEFVDSPLYDKVVFNFDSVRPKGERLLGFGGTASGPDALKGIIEDIDRIIKECPTDRLRSIDCMDMMCAIAKGVVAGSSRRSAMICLFEQGDLLCANAKKGLYTDPDLAHKAYRCQSNNTECLSNKPTIDELRRMLETCKTEGEPGFNNYSEMVDRRVKAAQKYRPNESVEKYIDVGTNPCHEIILSAGLDGYSGSFCNLTTLPLPNFISDGVLDLDELETCVRLNTRASLRQTCVDIGMDGWSETQLEERLLGVSLTGCQDAFALLGWSTGSDEIEELLTKIRFWANDEADIYSKRLGVPRPLLVTCIKPEGTASQIFGVSNGLHWDWSPYYIRRVRMTAIDALAQTLMDQGYRCYPELYDLSNAGIDGDDDWSRLANFDKLEQKQKRKILNGCNTVVFEFPVKSYATRTQAEVSAIEQLENVKTFTTAYTDHMPSSTISVKDGEWDDVADWVSDNWDSFITASFFPYYGGAYPLLPYEQIDETEYNDRLAEIKDSNKQVNPNGRISYKVDVALLNRYERGLVDPDDVDLGSDCSTGACPIR